MQLTSSQLPAPSHLVEPVSSLPLAGMGSGAEGEPHPLHFYLSLLYRARWSILAAVFLVSIVTLLVSSRLSKTYESTVVIRVDPAEPRVVGQEQQAASGTDAEFLVNSEQNMLTSDAVLSETMHRLRLQDDDEFAPRAQKRATMSPEAVHRWVLHKLADRISVTRPLATLLLQVSVRSRSPQLSSQIANTLAASLLDHEYRTREEAITASSKYMGLQLDDLRAKMERSQAALVDYETRQDVLNPDDKTNVLQSRLQQTNADLGRAQSERVRLESEYRTAKAGDLDSVLASDLGLTLRPLEQKRQGDALSLAQLAQVYGPLHPLYREQAGVVQHDDAELQAQRDHLTAQLQNAYMMAQGRETMLTQLVNQEKHELDDFNLRAVRYSILKGEADSNAHLYYDLLQRTKEADVSAGFHSADGLRIVSSAEPDPNPVAPRVVLDTLMAFVLALMAACAVALARGMLDRTLVSPEQAEAMLGLRVLAWLPSVQPSDAAVALSPQGYSMQAFEREKEGDPGARGRLVPQRSAFHEAILSLQSTLLFAGTESSVILVTSALPGEGKSTFASNLAAALASANVRTLLIDADLRKPKVHRAFGLPNRCGLSNVLRGDATLTEARHTAASAKGLDIITAGPPVAFSVELLQRSFAAFLDRVRGDYQFILLDCPPVLGLADALALSNFVDSVLLLARAGVTDRRLVAAALRQLRTARAPIQGLILNQVHRELNEYYSYYNSGYYAESNDADENA